MTTPEWITPRQCAAILNVSKQTVYRRIDEGDIKAIRVGRSLRIPQNDLNTYIHNIQTVLDNHQRAITRPTDRFLRASTPIVDHGLDYRSDRKARA